MKRNFEKMMAEYSKNENEQTRRAFTFGDYEDIVNFAEDKHRREDGGGYLVRIHPSSCMHCFSDRLCLRTPYRQS